jgi:hypothetical protein
MTDLTAKRTLVKSPPELWTELSEVESLARHLGEFGEIRITKLEPETTVAWEGERASGTVEIEASGWGTKVTLTAAVVQAEEPPAEPAPPSKSGPPVPDAAASEPQGAAAEPQAALKAASTEPVAPTVERKPPPAAWEAPRVAPPARPEPGRGGFLTRLFGRRPAAEPPRPVWQPPRPPARPAVVAPEPAPVASEPPPVASEPPPVASEPAATPGPPSAHPPEAQPPETKTDSPELARERALAVLEGALDTLGSAHHRPFSRE